MIDGRSFFDQPVKSVLRTYDNIWKNKLVKVMITQLGVYYIIHILKNTIS